MESLAAPSMATLSEFKPQDIANTAWSFANVGFKHEPLLAAISACAIAKIEEFQPQDLGNTFWAFAKVEVMPDELLKTAISAASLRRISELEPQNLAMTAWSFSTLGIVDEELMSAIACRAVGRIAEFAIHDLSNLLWSYPALELDAGCGLFGLARRLLAERLPADSAAVIEKLAARTVTTYVVAEVSEFTNSLLEFAWSFAFAGEDMVEVGDILRRCLLAIATVLDERCSWQSLLGPSSGAVPYGLGPSWGSEVPSIVLDLPGIVVVLKPPHWEVDARAGGSLPGDSSGAPLFSSFLRRRFPREVHPLMHCNEQQFGIIHRLDAPSSGLILAGKNFVGYYTLRWQQDTYELGREYLVLCHGRMCWGPRVINAKIKTSKAFPATSTVSDEGKPAWTQVEPICILERKGSTEEQVTLVAIIIRTGRTHQIRVHLKHIGHPTVTDGKYTDQLTYNSDKEWCSRNFLHRHRLTFVDTDGLLREAVAALPKDLCEVLRGLHPADDGQSPGTMRRLLEGWMPGAALV
mmetsp:Transcript_42058/g.136103  ORF Transcript_42058/g.136103 Transcript_42058/m.136103 type:complete len:522 (+) Transcript_42058:236-1801(+)